MAEKHKSKYKKPENTKYKSRKDLKDYTEDDKKGTMNPKSTGEKQSNVLRKTDKEFVDNGDMYVKYNADDRLYKDLEDGEYDPKHAAKVLKKRQDKDEKDNAKNIKDKIENLTREQKEYLVREYVRRKINLILEQPTATATPTEPAVEDPLATDPAAAPAPTDPAASTPTPTPTDPTAATPVTDPLAAAPAVDATAPVDPATASTPTPTDPAAAPAPADPSAAAPTPTDQPQTNETDKVISGVVSKLQSEESGLDKIKYINKILTTALPNTEENAEANASFYKLLRMLSIKKISNIPSMKKQNQDSDI